MTRAVWLVHASLMGVVQRYLVVLKFGTEAMRSGDEVDYQRFYQQQSDVVMLRLFDSFGECAPQLVFHLYVMIKEYYTKDEWSVVYASWTGLSAISSVISLGWGIAAYSSAMRMTKEDKLNMSWTGMIFQTFWRAGMLTARIVALIVLAMALEEWAIAVMCKRFNIQFNEVWYFKFRFFFYLQAYIGWS